MKSCTEIDDDLIKFNLWAEVFTLSPTRLLPQISVNTAWNYYDICAHIQLALNYFDEEDYFNMGKKLGEALVLATDKPMAEYKITRNSQDL